MLHVNPRDPDSSHTGRAGEGARKPQGSRLVTVVMTTLSVDSESVGGVRVARAGASQR